MKLTIIGAGPGGYETALAASKLGIQVTIVSDGPVGGTCLNEGCIPTKTLCRNAEMMEFMRESEIYGIEELSYSFNYKKVIERKKEVVEQLRGGVEFLLKGKNINLLYGKASFKDARTIYVEHGSGATEVSSDYIIIATGSVSSVLPVPGKELPGVLSSKELLELEEVPRRLCIIGAGVIGLEFASIFKSFGSEVFVIEYCKDILPRFDTGLSKRLKQALTKRGIAIETSSRVLSISEEASGELSVKYMKKEEESTFFADKVLMAVGRSPNTASLNLEEAGVEFTDKGIKVNNNMETSVTGIYAVGDVTGGMMLAHTAVFQGLKALQSIAGDSVEKLNIDFSIVPAAVFTKPEVACVGLTEEGCKERGFEVKCLKSFFRANGKAISMNEPEGYCKIIIYTGQGRKEIKYGTILGCHIFGAHASDIVQEMAALMNTKATIYELKSVIHAHPGLTEVLQAAAHSF